MNSLGESDEEWDTLAPGYAQSSSPSYKFDGGNCDAGDCLRDFFLLL